MNRGLCGQCRTKIKGKYCYMLFPPYPFKLHRVCNKCLRKMEKELGLNE